MAPRVSIVLTLSWYFVYLLLIEVLPDEYRTRRFWEKILGYLRYFTAVLDRYPSTRLTAGYPPDTRSKPVTQPGSPNTRRL